MSSPLFPRPTFPTWSLLCKEIFTCHRTSPISRKLYTIKLLSLDRTQPKCDNRAVVAKTSYWFTLKGSNVNYVGTKDVNNGWIYSYGQAWWDANVYPNTGATGRPHLLSFNAQTGSLQHFKSMKPIAWNVNLQGSNIMVTDTIIDAYSTTGSFPFNTDGFDVGVSSRTTSLSVSISNIFQGTNITFYNSVIYNGDDAIAIGSGASNVLFQKATIGYQTHGMSIGSLGSSQTAVASVSNIKVRLPGVLYRICDFIR